MTQEELFKFQEKTFADLLALMKQKNNDYTNNAGHHNNDALKNFKLVEHYNVCTVEQGMFARMSDKMSRLASFISSGTLSVKGESVADALKDLVGYSVLLLAHLEEKRLNNIEVDKFVEHAERIMKAEEEHKNLGFVGEENRPEQTITVSNSTLLEEIMKIVPEGIIFREKEMFVDAKGKVGWK